VDHSASRNPNHQSSKERLRLGPGAASLLQADGLVFTSVFKMTEHYSPSQAPFTLATLCGSVTTRRRSGSRLSH